MLLQATNHLSRRDVAVGSTGFRLIWMRPLFKRRIHTIRTDKRGQTGDRRILQDHISELLLLVGHRRKGN